MRMQTVRQFHAWMVTLGDIDLAGREPGLGQPIG
jgi:hypothetical protein